MTELLLYGSGEVPEGLSGGEAGIHVATRLVLRLRFERLLDGDREAGRWFHTDTRGFAAAFGRYHREVPPTAWTPSDEATLWRKWRADDEGGP